MIEKNIPRYQSMHVLWMYRLVDFCVPFLMLVMAHFLLSHHPWREPYTLLGCMAGFLFVVFTQLLGGYSRFSDRSIAKKIEIVFKTWAFNVLLLIFIAYLNSAVIELARSIILVWVVLTPITILLVKLVVNRGFDQNDKIIVVLGNGYEFTDFEISRLERQKISLVMLNSIDPTDLKNKVAKHSADYLLMNLSDTANNKLIKELTKLELEGVKLLSLPNFMEIFLRKCFIPYESMDLSYLSRIRSFSRKDLLLKRLTDLICAFCLGLLTSPVMLWAAIKIRKESPGPIIFSQARVARGGNEKIIYKFRSMHVDAEKHGAQFASKDDPRAYEFGAFMRKTRIDELPQLRNVIKGDLHFVGPRPERKVFTDQLEEEIPYYNERHLVSPGITGWAQVLYPYGANTEDARQKLMYDLYYIKHWTIWLEIETLIRTVGVIIGKKGW